MFLDKKKPGITGQVVSLSDCLAYERQAGAEKQIHQKLVNQLLERGSYESLLAR